MPPLPKREERPLTWWENIRRDLGVSASSFSLKLGVLHRVIFPERHALSKKWHDPGADVTMTMNIIEAYFDRAKNRAIVGKIDSYFLAQENSVAKDDTDMEDRSEEDEDDENEDDENEDDEDMDIDKEGEENTGDEDEDDDDDYRNGEYEDDDDFDEHDIEHMINAGLFLMEGEDEEGEEDDEEEEEDLLSEREE